MTTPDRSPFDDAPEADRVEQAIPVDPDGEVADDSWAGDLSADRAWQADEADLLEQAREVPLDDPDLDR
jgi:hypothetical protein